MKNPFWTFISTKRRLAGFFAFNWADDVSGGWMMWQMMSADDVVDDGSEPDLTSAEGGKQFYRTTFGARWFWAEGERSHRLRDAWQEYGGKTAL